MYESIPEVIFNDDKGTITMLDIIPTMDDLLNHIRIIGSVNIVATNETENKLTVSLDKFSISNLKNLLHAIVTASLMYLENKIIVISAIKDKMNPTSTERKGSTINIAIPVIEVMLR